MRTLPIAASLAALVAQPFADTIVVDDDGGPGVDYTDIQSAADAAAPDDIVLVHEGTYSGFLVFRGITVVGASSGSAVPEVEGMVQVIGLDAARHATLARLEMDGLEIADCDGVVVVENCTVLANGPNTPATVTNSVDVRLHRTAIYGDSDGLVVTNARAELVQCVVQGVSGASGTSPGGTGLVAAAGSVIHASLCSIDGGDGHDEPGGRWTPPDGGPGGIGVHVHAGGYVTVAGEGEVDPTPFAPSLRVLGGHAGDGGICSEDGDPGVGVVVDDGGTFRHSAIHINGGGVWCGDPGPAFEIAPGGVVEEPASPFPVLRIDGDANPGGTLELFLRGDPGDLAYVLVGFDLLVLPIPGVFENLLVLPQLVAAAGTVPAEGVIEATLGVPPSFALYSDLYFQGLLAGAAGVRMTASNSLHSY